MSKLLSFVCATLLFATHSAAHAQSSSTSSEQQQSASETKTLTDVRIAVVKHALQLTPEQAKYWPVIEEAIQARAEARRERLAKFSERVRGEPGDRDLIKVLQQRAETLSQRGASLKRLADAWQPLYTTLSDEQKQRMRVLAALVVHGVRERIEARREEMEDDEASDWSSATGAGTGESGSSR